MIWPTWTIYQFNQIAIFKAKQVVVTYFRVHIILLRKPLLSIILKHNLFSYRLESPNGGGPRGVRRRSLPRVPVYDKPHEADDDSDPEDPQWSHDMNWPQSATMYQFRHVADVQLTFGFFVNHESPQIFKFGRLNIQILSTFISQIKIRKPWKFKKHIYETLHF